MDYKGINQFANNKKKASALHKSVGTDNLFGVHKANARNLRDIVPPNSVDVTITSPPYFDLKDYGTYLEDLGEVFEGVHKCTKK